MTPLIRKANYEDAEAIQNLILLFTENGQMLYRSLPEIQQNIDTFLVCEQEDHLAGVCSLKTGGDQYVEVRSLVVHPRFNRQGIGTALVRESIECSLATDSQVLFVLTYAAPLFIKLGFGVVDKSTLPMKIWNDCQSCLHRDKCDEIALTLSLKALKTSRLKNIPLNNSPEVLY
ncbi:MAG: GNAT family N-acetyltransferase [Nitrospinae bacterium]|jgi:amino-acid N-acetyltransferase|nr:GNAT family N-acetyltransferase [Nitrospinota bacterium]MDA1109876.1 GNAT family N-acetyltransferase [Nitrospinota bacterium]